MATQTEIGTVGRNRLEGKSAIITGGDQGIGCSIALRFAAEGGTAEDVAGVAAFLASADSDYVTGSTVFVDGGLLWSYEEQ